MIKSKPKHWAFTFNQIATVSQYINHAQQDYFCALCLPFYIPNRNMRAWSISLNIPLVLLVPNFTPFDDIFLVLKRQVVVLFELRKNFQASFPWLNMNIWPSIKKQDWLNIKGHFFSIKWPVTAVQQVIVCENRELCEVRLTIGQRKVYSGLSRSRFFPFSCFPPRSAKGSPHRKVGSRCQVRLCEYGATS